MKPFTFRLESVQKLRAREEEQARELFDKALQARFQAELELGKARADLDRCEQAVAVKRAGRMTGGDHLLFLNAARLQREACERLAVRLQSAKKELENRRGLFLAARRSHQAILRLRERKQRAHDAAELRREENAIGDLIASRHLLKGTGAFA